jgi:signal transduction histidine kinase
VRRVERGEKEVMEFTTIKGDGRASGCSVWRIWVFNEGENMLELKASAGMYTRTDGFHSRKPITDKTKIGWIAKEKRDIHINVNIDTLPKETIILGEREMIINAIDNILSNAIKYTPDGKGIAVTAKAEERSAVIEVRDEGVGIPREKMKYIIFEPFFSLEDVYQHSTGQYKYKGGGIGLGLTLAHMIMEYHSGKLTIESAGENMGTTVTMSFPLAEKSA